MLILSTQQIIFAKWKILKTEKKTTGLSKVGALTISPASLGLFKHMRSFTSHLDGNVINCFNFERIFSDQLRILKALVFLKSLSSPVLLEFFLLNPILSNLGNFV